MTVALLALAACYAMHTAGAASIADVVQPFLDRHEIAGGVLLVTDRRNTIDTEVFGYANLAKQGRMEANSLFWIASMSKPMAATAVMMLVDKGKLDLDAPITHYLPYFKPALVTIASDGRSVLKVRPRTPITLRQLLSHTSGLPFSSAPESPILDVAPLSVRVRTYAAAPLLWEPGSNYHYSNAGINTAAHVVEVVTGIPYDRFVQQRIFDPLKMRNTTFFPSAAQIAHLATAYFPLRDGSLEEIPLAKLHYPASFVIQRRYVIPAAGLFSTAEDMAAFSRLLLNEGTVDRRRLLSQHAIQEMTRQQNSIDMAKRNTAYGLGWAVGSDSAFGHGGAYGTDFYIDTAKGLAMVWMVQIAAGHGAESGDLLEAATMTRFAAVPGAVQ